MQQSRLAGRGTPPWQCALSLATRLSSKPPPAAPTARHPSRRHRSPSVHRCCHSRPQEHFQNRTNASETVAEGAAGNVSLTGSRFHRRSSNLGRGRVHPGHGRGGGGRGPRFVLFYRKGKKGGTLRIGPSFGDPSQARLLLRGAKSSEECSGSGRRFGLCSSDWGGARACCISQSTIDHADQLEWHAHPRFNTEVIAMLCSSSTGFRGLLARNIDSAGNRVVYSGWACFFHSVSPNTCRSRTGIASAARCGGFVQFPTKQVQSTNQLRYRTFLRCYPQGNVESHILFSMAT